MEHTRGTKSRSFGGRVRTGYKRSRAWLWSLFAVSFLIPVAGPGVSAPPQPEPEAETSPTNEELAGTPAPRRIHLVSVPLPIRDLVDSEAKQSIERVIQEPVAEGPRPILILAFDPAADGADLSEFERAFSLARFLASDRLNGWRTIAFLPEGARGHAVLPAIACEEIIMGADAPFGEAGLHEPHVDQSLRQAYIEIAERRRTVPVAVVLGMLDPALEVSRAQTLDGTVFVLADELERLRQNSSVSRFDSVIAAGDLGSFTGRDLRLKYGFVSHLAEDRAQLAAALKIPRAALRDNEPAVGEWQAVSVDLNGPMNAKTVDWVIRTMDDRLSRDDINLLIVRVNSPGGSPENSVRLANYFSSLEARSIRTAALVASQARGDAAIVVVACDKAYLTPDAILGGPGATTISSRNLPALKTAIRAVADSKQRDWSLPVALVDPSTVVHRYERAGSGEIRYLTQEAFSELANQGDWTRSEEIPTADGLSASEAIKLGLAEEVVSSLAELRSNYQLREDVPALEPNWAHLFIERLASPRLAGVLLFIALFALIIEFSQPGLGVAGFTSALCFVLYFWSQHLHGTAGWLEVSLFLVGVASILVEIFVVPGLGVFGLGGGALVIASIVLASQTFVIPLNSYQLEQMPKSLGTVVAACFGAFVSLLLVRKYLSDAPLVRRLLLATPDDEQIEELNRRESMVDLQYLSGKRGQTTTQLTPSGKARFGDDIVNVISEGSVIPVNAAVVVTEVRGNQVWVRNLDPNGIA